MPERPRWRLVVDEPGNGAWNMAVDEAILDAVVAGEVPATLRFYGWCPHCISIGYAQKLHDFDLELCDGKWWIIPGVGLKKDAHISERDMGVIRE